MISSKPDSEVFVLANTVIGSGIFDKPHKISKEELNMWQSNYPIFSNLIKDERIQLAASIASTHYFHPRLSIRIANIWSGIEAMIGVDQELRFRIALYVSKLFGESHDEVQKLFKETKKLYDGRSKCVHGTGLKTRAQEETLYKKSLKLLCDLILNACESEKVPDKKDIEKTILS